MDNNQNTKIFGSLEIDSTETIKTLIDEMNREQAMFLLSESIKYSHRRGVFSLLESEIVSKAIRKIYEVTEIPTDNQ